MALFFEFAKENPGYVTLWVLFVCGALAGFRPFSRGDCCRAEKEDSSD